MGAPGPRDVKPRTIVHLVPHTHWDREWYEPFQTFRLRLVDLVDGLLERMDRDSRLRFTLDGQCATVDDYLEIRPEAEPLIRRLVAEGRLAIGPWQILMDEFLVSGETIVRNLELGWARATELGAAMPIGYLPDMFGHIAQMPQILRRAGIERAVVWRGVPSAIERNQFIWRAPDGSSVLAEYLPDGYGSGASLFDVPDRLGSKLVAFVQASVPYYGERSVLAMYGTDHAVPTPRLAELVDRVNGERDDIEVRLETLTEYVAIAGEDAAAEPADATTTWSGEMRSAARANLLMNVTSARMDVKAAAARAERILERYAEPLAALHGATWPARQFDLAWRRLIDNSAHDSICGCSHDAVNAQVLVRYAEAEQLARGVLGRTLDRIAGRVGGGRLAVVNPSPAQRDDLVELELVVPPEWTSVAIRQGERLLPTQEIARPDPTVAELRLTGRQALDLLGLRRHGRELFGKQIKDVSMAKSPDGDLSIVIAADTVADPPELDVDELVETITAVIAARPNAMCNFVVRGSDRRIVLVRATAPPLGWAAVEAAQPANAPFTEVPVVADGASMSNGTVRVDVAEDGLFSLEADGVVLRGLGRIVDGGDFGDSYNYGPPLPDRVVELPTSVRISTSETGPLRGRMTVARTYDWPRGVEPNGRGRTEGTVAAEVVTELELRAGEPFIRVRVTFENRSRDHRVRWHMPLAGPVTQSVAEGQFAVVVRDLQPEGGHGEVPLGTFPAHGFVSAGNLAVLLDQVTEYEVVDGRELALTILRSFGLISRNANPSREDPAGPEVPVTDGQQLGPWSIGFALMPHASGWADAHVLEASEGYRQPFLVVTGVAGNTEPEEAGTGLSVEGRGVVLSALRRRAGWLEIRIVAEHPDPGAAVISGSFDRAREVDVLGRSMGDLEAGDGRIRLPIGPWQIRTLQVRRGPESTPPS